MNEPVTRPTDVDPSEFIASVENTTRRSDAEKLLELMASVTGKPAVMWGPTIVGFGQYHFRYSTGHQGAAPGVGFSPRKSNLVVYGLTYGENADRMLDQLGKHKRGASCVYVNKLADIDLDVLRHLVTEGYSHVTNQLDSPVDE